MRSLLTLLFLFFYTFVFCQETKSIVSYKFLDSISSDKKKVITILEIPFDKATKDINSYNSVVDLSIKLSQKIEDSLLLAKSFQKKSLILHFSSKEKASIEYTLKAINIYKKLGLNNELADSYLKLGWKIKHRDLKNAKSYMKKGIDILENDAIAKNELIFGYNNYGVLLKSDKKLDSAIFYHKKSLQLAKKNRDSISIPFAYTHIASIEIKKKNFTLAKKYLDSSLLIRSHRNDTYGITDTELYLGDLFFEKRNFSLAIKHFKTAYNLAKKNQYYPLHKYASELLFKSYDSLANYKESLFYHKIFTKMKDSVLNKNTNDKISELTIRFKTIEKEKEIALQKEEILEKQLQIKNKNLLATILGSSLFILIILSIGYFHRSRYIKKQLQKEIELKDALSTIKTQNRLQEQRLNISRDLHDNIGSQLTFIISSIDNLKFISKDLNEKVTDKLSNISAFTSDTIFQLRDTIWAMNKNNITSDDIHSRILSFIEKAKIAKPDVRFTTKFKLEGSKNLTSIQGMNLFRVIQEAINNAIKYANASTISIHASETKNQISFNIKDNGEGFNLTNITLGNGLKNMEKRMSEINGEVIINSKPNQGTDIKIICNL